MSKQHQEVFTPFKIEQEPTKEQIVVEISKLIYEYRKYKKPVDNYFIEKLVEIIVSAKSLHHYVKDIKFYNYSKDYVALYHDRTLKIYKTSISEEFGPFDLTQHDCSYYRMVSIIRHEIEHARQLQMVDEKRNTLEAQLLKVGFQIFPKYNDYFEKIVELPIPIFLIMNILMTLYLKKDFKKYIENWRYAPQERIAEIRANALILKLLELEKQSFKEIQNIFETDMFFFLLQGYDKRLGPTDFYFSELGLSEKWKRVEKSSSLDLEEKLLFGFPLTLEELKEVKQNKEKTLSAMKKVC